MRAPLRKALGVGRQSWLARRQYSTPTQVVLTNSGQSKTRTRRIGDIAYYSLSVYLFYRFYAFAKAQLSEATSDDTSHSRPSPTSSNSSLGRQGAPSNTNTTQLDLAADSTLVVPLSWPKQRPPEYYEGSSKEWQDFRGLALDAQRRKNIQVAVARRALVEFQTAGPGGGVGGDRESRITGIGLDFQFPQNKPTRYERYALVFSGSKILLGKEIMKSEDYARLRNILMPWPAVQALRATYRFWRKSRQLPKDGQMISTSSQQVASSHNSDSPTTSAGSDTLFGSWFSTPNSLQIPRSNDMEQSQNMPGSKQSLFRLLPSTSGLFNPETREELAHCGVAFRYLLRSASKSTKPRPDGFCYVHGEVGFHGRTHCGKLNVIAVVMPATGEIVDVSTRLLWIKPNSIRPRIK